MGVAPQNMTQMVCLVLKEWSSNRTNKMLYYIHRVDSRTEKRGNKINQFDAVQAGLTITWLHLFDTLHSGKKSILKINNNCSERVSSISQSSPQNGRYFSVSQWNSCTKNIHQKKKGGDEKGDRFTLGYPFDPSIRWNIVFQGSI